MINLTITWATTHSYVSKRLRAMLHVTREVEELVMTIEVAGQVTPPIAVWLDETREPESVRVVVEKGAIDAFVGMPLDLVKNEFTEAQFATALRRVIEVALLRVPLPEKIALAIRDAVDKWAIGFK